MTQLADAPVSHPPTDSRPTRRGGTFARLFRFALATIRRRPERTVFAVAGIGLAIAAVVVVRTVAAGYQASGVDAVTTAVGGAPYWAVPEGGVRLAPAAGALVPDGPVPQVRAPGGWTADSHLVGLMPGHAGVVLDGHGSAAYATATPAALRRLGPRVTVGGRTLPVREAPGAGARLTVPADAARAAGVRTGWVRLRPPPGTTPAQVRRATGLPVVSDPARRPGPGGLVYATSQDAARGDFLDFDQKFAAVFAGQVGSSVLGLVSTVGLVLGFVIAVTGFVASVRERRREFGIMASIGLSDEVLYFFLVESVLVFLAAYAFGVLAGGAVVALVLPAFFTLGAWLGASGLVAMYLPALAIVAALVPVHRLLQQRPVQLLADAP